MELKIWRTATVVMMIALIGMIVFGEIKNGGVTTTDVKESEKMIEQKNELERLAVKMKPLDENEVWNLVQNWRASHNLNVQIKDDTLCDFAALRLNQIKRENSHDLFTSQVARLILRSTNFKLTQENLMRSHIFDYNDQSINNREVLNAWLKSASHKATLEADYTHACIKCDEIDCVQIFAR